ncbi:MAG: hypothetical protein IJM90_08230 [Firmicutes bacterium]|nr:hypothetical protein [Bacillota bacterium]
MKNVRRMLACLLIACLLSLMTGCAKTSIIAKPNPIEHAEELYGKSRSEVLTILGLTAEDLLQSRQERARDFTYQRADYLTDDLYLNLNFTEDQEEKVLAYTVAVAFKTTEERWKAYDNLLKSLKEKYPELSQPGQFSLPDNAEIWLMTSDELPNPMAAGDESRVVETKYCVYYKVRISPSYYS